MIDENRKIINKIIKKDIKVWEKKHPGVMYTCKVGLPNWLR
jgi:ribosomal protein L16/L10AE